MGQLITDAHTWTTGQAVPIAPAGPGCIEIDIDYVERWSLRRDLLVLARTALVVLGRQGTYKGPRGEGDPLRTPRTCLPHRFQQHRKPGSYGNERG